MAKKKLLTVKQAAEKAEVCEQAIYDAINEKRLPAVVDDGHYLIAYTDIMRFNRRRPGRKAKP